MKQYKSLIGNKTHEHSNNIYHNDNNLYINIINNTGTNRKGYYFSLKSHSSMHDYADSQFGRKTRYHISTSK